MFSFLGRSRAFLLVITAVAVGCSPPAPIEANVTPEDVVLAYVDEGLDAEVADCLVGLGSREFELDALLPDAAPAEDALLLDEMLRSCTDAVAVLSEEDVAERTSFDTGPFNIGDDVHLDELYTKCSRGDGVSCDLLWQESPVGSIYESFGVSCGNRPEILDCTAEMNGSDETPEDVN